MKTSQFFISTMKEAPADAEVASQKLMLRAGMIRKLAAGIYTYLPMGLRSIRKVENVIREEMNRAGAVELSMPIVQPAELWQESGRWQKMGDELLRVQDRHERHFAIQPTSEEAIADVVRAEVRSYKQLPVHFYQIQTKFRDERRPRFGVMRGREFTMKDAYSFDRDQEGAMRTYQSMFETYTRIFNRLGLAFRAVSADTGNIGGKASHEFQVIAETGEDQIVYCPESTYAANIETAEALAPTTQRNPVSAPLNKVPTPGKVKCEDVAGFLNIALDTTVKSIVLASDQQQPASTLWLLLLRGDHVLNEVKVGKLDGLQQGWRLATEAEIIQHFGCKPGYLGPVNVPENITVIADRTVASMSDFVCGANEEGFHLTGVNFGRDVPEPRVADIRHVVAGDPSPDGQGRLAIQRGIEVGHIFAGLPYAETMGLRFIDEDGTNQPMCMGCYGIGVTRLLGAAIEQNHDDKGIIWPTAMAPFHVVICPIGADRSEAVRVCAQQLHDQLEAAGIEVILDDRGERPGAMFADWELIGVPYRITIGDRGLKEGKVELQHRRDPLPTALSMADAIAQVTERVQAELRRL